MVIMCLYNAQFMKYQLFLANKLLEAHNSVVSIAMRNPYDIDLLVRPQTTIKTFEYTPLSMDSLLSVLF
ncbi:MAG: hypothetical protein ATN31_03290 [Candidatus Epulonipiscioides saccharophilum]|nr:MAG: hypothetical protein ATN31_03290 [Epulopiscium sp. AS2M-Bin001]